MKKTRNSCQASSGSEQMSFLPEPDFNPKLPSKNTLTYKALSMMLRGKKITHRNFDTNTCSWRLAAYIEILKNDLGWPVCVEKIMYCPVKKPKKRYVSRYFLSSGVIKKAKKMGVVV
jgi:hypothetical protein